MFPIPVPDKEENTMSIGLCLRNVKPEYIVCWAKRYAVHSYTTMANIYPMFVIQKITYHEILILIQEYLLALETGKLRVVYKHNHVTKAPSNLRSDLTTMPLPYLDVYLSHDNL